MSSPKNLGLALFLATLVLGAAAAAEARPEAAPRAHRGELDLSGLAAGRPVALEGEWAFYWDRFVDPTSPAEPDIYGVLPGEWADYQLPGVEPLGHASYRLRVRGIDPDLDLGLSIGSFLSAARIYADGVLVFEQGRPGDSAAAETAAWKPTLARLGRQADGELDLVAHVSNHVDREGGNKSPILLGDYDDIARKRERDLVSEFFVVGAVVVMGLYYLCLFAFRPSDRSPVFFALLCMVLGLRILCYDQYYLGDIFPSLSWEWLFKAGYLTFSLAVMLTSAFIYSLYPKIFGRTAFILALAVPLVYSGMIAFGQPILASNTLMGFQIFTVLLGLHISVVLFRAIRRRERGSLILTSGFLLFFAAVFYDILASNGTIKGGFFITHFGLLVFLFSLSLVITRKFAGAFATAETLSAELARANRAMRRFLPEEFLARLGKTSFEDIGLGDHAEQDMTVLFADIGSFTRLSEAMSPKETFDFINEYLARMGPVIRSHGGFVDKYLGDGIMALFPSSTENAVRCAIDMHRALNAYNEERRAAGREAISIGIGVHTGRLMLGTIGENERMDGTVISDVVNLASRIEGIAKEYAIGLVVSERILLGLEDPNAFHLRFLGKIPVKGKREPISVFEIFDGDPEELRKAKDGIRAPFEKAISAFYTQEHRAAAEGFKAVLERLPSDEASHHYLRIIRKLDLA